MTQALPTVLNLVFKGLQKLADILSFPAPSSYCRTLYPSGSIVLCTDGGHCELDQVTIDTEVMDERLILHLDKSTARPNRETDRYI